MRRAGGLGKAGFRATVGLTAALMLVTGSASAQSSGGNPGGDENPGRDRALEGTLIGRDPQPAPPARRGRSVVGPETNAPSTEQTRGGVQQHPQGVHQHPQGMADQNGRGAQQSGQSSQQNGQATPQKGTHQNRAGAKNSPQAKGGEARTARAELQKADGSSAGTVTLTETPNGVLVQGELRNLSPGVHAIHVHQTGKCEAPSFKSAGDHFSPRGHAHGFKAERGPHAGDLPNVHVGSDGTARLEIMAVGLRLHGKQGALDRDGAAIVVHEKADDYSSQPSGDAGGRAACGALKAR